MYCMIRVILGTTNPYKRNKLAGVVAGYFESVEVVCEEVHETKNTFLEVAEEKALSHSLQHKGFVIASDGGADIPGLKSWKSTHTKRYGVTDEERQARLLKEMHALSDRTIVWREAIALARDGHLIFSSEAEHASGVISEKKPEKTVDHLWLHSLTQYPQFGDKLFVELSTRERAKVECGWDLLHRALGTFTKNYFFDSYAQTICTYRCGFVEGEM